MKLQLVLAALVVCVAFAAADKPHVMRKLVAQSKFVQFGSNGDGNEYKKVYYVDSSTVHARWESSLGDVYVRTRNKEYVFHDGSCEYTASRGDPAQDIYFGTLNHSCPGYRLAQR